MVELTERARDILQRSIDAARRMNPDVVIRIAPHSAGVQPALAERPLPDDAATDIENVWVARDVEGVIDGGEHDSLVLREG